jgi:streptogramin lyase
MTRPHLEALEDRCLLSLSSIIQPANVTELPANSGADAITAGPDGNLWFTQGAGNQIGILNPQTRVVTELGSQNGLTGHGLAGITTGPNNTVWFTEFDSNKIGKIDLNHLDPTTGLPTITEYGGLSGIGPQSIVEGALIIVSATLRERPTTVVDVTPWSGSSLVVRTAVQRPNR